MFSTLAQAFRPNEKQRGTTLDTMLEIQLLEDNCLRALMAPFAGRVPWLILDLIQIQIGFLVWPPSAVYLWPSSAMCCIEVAAWDLISAWPARVS